MKTKNRIYAVLTGDLVDSSKLAPADLKAVMQSLRDAATRFNDTYPDTIVGQLDVYSGDGWQLLMSDWRRSIRAALYLRAIAKGREKVKPDTRIAIGCGDVDMASINSERISESTGDAFTASGRALSEMERGVHMALTSQTAESDTETSILSASVLLLDDIVTRWKPAQARAVSLSLLGYTQEQVAQELKISQPTANQAIQGAGFWALEGFLKAIEYR